MAGSRRADPLDRLRRDYARSALTFPIGFALGGIIALAAVAYMVLTGMDVPLWFTSLWVAFALGSYALPAWIVRHNGNRVLAFAEQIASRVTEAGLSGSLLLISFDNGVVMEVDDGASLPGAEISFWRPFGADGAALTPDIATVADWRRRYHGIGILKFPDRVRESAEVRPVFDRLFLDVRKGEPTVHVLRRLTGTKESPGPEVREAALFVTLPGWWRKPDVVAKEVGGIRSALDAAARLTWSEPVALGVGALRVPEPPRKRTR